MQSDAPSAAAQDALVAAAQLAGGLLFPHALEVDGADSVPVAHLDAIAGAGLYGMAGPRQRGGLGLDPAAALGVIEQLASGCLTTTFVWLQHHSAVRAVTAAGGALEDEWLAPLCRGERRAGIAFAGLRRLGPPVLTAEREASGEGYVLTGHAPWVTGWGLVDVLLVAARLQDEPDMPIVWALVDATPGAGLETERLRLVAVDASVTVTATFDGYRVPPERVVGTEDFAAWRQRDAAGLRTNGSLSLGLAARCRLLLAEMAVDGRPEAGVAARLTGAIEEARRRLDSAGPGELPSARAEAAELAHTAAGLLVAATGGRAVLAESVAQMLARQAIFLLVFGQTPAIRSVQLGAGETAPPGVRSAATEPR